MSRREKESSAPCLPPNSKKSLTRDRKIQMSAAGLGTFSAEIQASIPASSRKGTHNRPVEGSPAGRPPSSSGTLLRQTLTTASARKRLNMAAQMVRYMAGLLPSINAGRAGSPNRPTLSANAKGTRAGPAKSDPGRSTRDSTSPGTMNSAKDAKKGSAGATARASSEKGFSKTTKER